MKYLSLEDKSNSVIIHEYKKSDKKWLRCIITTRWGTLANIRYSNRYVLKAIELCVNSLETIIIRGIVLSCWKKRDKDI